MTALMEEIRNEWLNHGMKMRVESGGHCICADCDRAPILEEALGVKLKDLEIDLFSSIQRQ